MSKSYLYKIQIKSLIYAVYYLPYGVLVQFEQHRHYIWRDILLVSDVTIMAIFIKAVRTNIGSNCDSGMRIFMYI